MICRNWSSLICVGFRAGNRVWLEVQGGNVGIFQPGAEGGRQRMPIDAGSRSGTNSAARGEGLAC